MAGLVRHYYSVGACASPMSALGWDSPDGVLRSVLSREICILKGCVQVVENPHENSTVTTKVFDVV